MGNDIKHSKGNNRYPDGSVYKGKYYNGAKEGQGIFKAPDGIVQIWHLKMEHLREIIQLTLYLLELYL